MKNQKNTHTNNNQLKGIINEKNLTYNSNKMDKIFRNELKKCLKPIQRELQALLVDTELDLHKRKDIPVHG